MNQGHETVWTGKCGLFLSERGHGLKIGALADDKMNWGQIGDRDE